MLSAMTSSTRLVPFRGHETWVQITAPDDARTGALPLFVLHGGPGMAHNYVRNIAELAGETGRTVIHYDQIGCGNSTHLPDAPADFWTPDLFVDEFHTVREALGIDEYHLLGQSWGGMLSAEIAVRQPPGLASLSICNSPASMELWMAGCAELRAQLPAETQAALDRHEQADTVTDPEYLEATNEFYRRGTLRGWSIIDRLAKITAPTLVIAGEFDEATPAAWQPYVDHIADATSHVFSDASHCSHLEKPEEFRAVVADFLASHDAV